MVWTEIPDLITWRNVIDKSVCVLKTNCHEISAAFQTTILYYCQNALLSPTRVAIFCQVWLWLVLCFGLNNMYALVYDMSRIYIHFAPSPPYLSCCPYWWTVCLFIPMLEKKELGIKLFGLHHMLLFHQTEFLWVWQCTGLLSLFVSLLIGSLPFQTREDNTTLPSHFKKTPVS